MHESRYGKVDKNWILALWRVYPWIHWLSAQGAPRIDISSSLFRQGYWWQVAKIVYILDCIEMHVFVQVYSFWILINQLGIKTVGVLPPQWVCCPLLGNIALLSLHLSTQRKVSTCTVCKIIKSAIIMRTFNVDHNNVHWILIIWHLAPS